MPSFIWELPAVRPAAESVESTGQGIDHITEAIDRLPQQFRGKPKIEALLRVLLTPTVALEQASIDLLTLTLDNAVGESLNIFGRKVGQKQVDVTDTTFRSLIRARIRANKSSGMGNQVLLVARLVLSDYAAQDDVVAAGVMALQIVPQPPAAYVLRVLNMDVPWDLADLLAKSFLEKITADGVRAILEFSVRVDDELDAHDNAFTLDDATDIGSVTTGGGFGDANGTESSTYATLDLATVTSAPTINTVIRWPVAGIVGNGKRIAMHVDDGAGNNDVQAGVIVGSGSEFIDAFIRVDSDKTQLELEAIIDASGVIEVQTPSTTPAAGVGSADLWIFGTVDDEDGAYDPDVELSGGTGEELVGGFLTAAIE
jgi:hypothetical protein